VNRGEVWVVDLDLPDRSPDAELGDRMLMKKLLVLLQSGGGFARATEVAFVIASTSRGLGALRPFEVLLDVSDGVHHDSIVDGRWVYTLPKAEIVGFGHCISTLSTERMEAIAVAIVVGLCL
jgi:mRNA-degrading endonuclease toxin of MazEF toxin-antitoxin module